MSEGTVKSHIDGNIGKVEFYHPAHNSLPSHLLAHLTQSIEELSGNEDLRAIVLSSRGERTFCAGASIAELAEISDDFEGKQFFLGFANVINAIRRSSKIVIGRIQGKAVGGGVGIAAACDYTLATKYASIRLSELSIGIGPFVIGPAVERKIGLSAFSQLTLNPTEWQTAAWAKDKGLYMEAFADNTQLDEYLDHYLEKLAQYSPDALRSIKKNLWKGTKYWDKILAKRAALSGKLVLTEQAQKAISSFLNA